MHGTVRVGNKRAGSKITPRPDEIVIDGDRKNKVLGNEHILHNHQDPVERAKVIRLHGIDREADRKRNGPIEQELQRIVELVKSGKNVIFMCWCSPRPCHCDPYKDRIEEILGSGSV